MLQMIIVTVVLSVALLAPYSEASCENPSTFPVLTSYAEYRYLCGIYYQEHGHDDAYFGCNGDGFWMEDGYTETVQEGAYRPFGSLIVKAGCTLTGYYNYNFQGDKQEFRGPVVVPKVHGPWDSGVDASGFPSYLCDCSMNYISCAPEDGFEVVLYCDASSASVDSICRYSKTIGTSFSSAISESMSIDSSIEASMKESFFDIFESGLSTSITTGYNWATTSEEAKNEQVTTEVEAIAPAGQILTIEQAVGHCSESTVKTEMYKITHFTPKGEIISSRIVHADEL